MWTLGVKCSFRSFFAGPSIQGPARASQGQRVWAQDCCWPPGRGPAGGGWWNHPPGGANNSAGTVRRASRANELAPGFRASGGDEVKVSSVASSSHLAFCLRGCLDISSKRRGVEHPWRF